MCSYDSDYIYKQYNTQYNTSKNTSKNTQYNHNHNIYKHIQNIYTYIYLILTTYHIDRHKPIPTYSIPVTIPLGKLIAAPAMIKPWNSELDSIRQLNKHL